MIQDKLDVAYIAARLEGFEETIISRLIDRAQYKSNLVIYEPGKSGFDGQSKRCLFDIRLLFHERMDTQFGRFFVPEERPFNKKLPVSKRIVHLPQSGLKIDNYDKVNLTGKILKTYIGLIPSLCAVGDDMQYGSSVELDVFAVQAVSRRIHYGALYIAESKYRSDPDTYRRLIEKNDIDAIMSKLTRKNVEEEIIARIREKTETIQSKVNRMVRNVIDPQIVVDYYSKCIIPLTKEGEILYLMNRCK